MSEDRRERLKRFLLEAERAGEEERAGLIDRLRTEDPALAREAESLLAQHTRGELAGRGIAEALGAAVGPLTDEPPSPGERRIGPYRLLELIGTGGMGAVYRAEQESPIRREVAVKLLRGGFDPVKILARFEEERRALALADHPGIARVLDAGEDESGTPYLVMELVRGVPITKFCSGRRLREALDLFISVCRAVQHAHQKGIIHRDLKPSNIIVSDVDGRAVAKIIDFGIARVVEEGSAGRVSLTGEGQIVGTLEYMSPEQASGHSREVDTRTDVYSLGAVLYELLTGTVPHDLTDKSMAEAIETIRRDPPRPFRETGVERRPDSDLETITRKALEIEPDRRYDGPAALADDIERYLRSEPIVARPPSTGYQLRTLVKRHRTAVFVGGSAAALVLVFGVTMSVLYAGQRRERERAEREAAKAEAVNRFLQEMLASADPAQLGRKVTVREVLDRSLSSLDRSFSGQPEVRAALLHTLGRTYGGLGDHPKADSLMRLALAQWIDLYGERHGNVSRTLTDLARIGFWRGRLAVADSLAARAILLLPRNSPPADLVEALHWRGLANTTGNGALAESLLEAACAMGRNVYPEESMERANLEGDLAYAYFTRGRYAEAEPVYRGALARFERLGGNHHPETLAALIMLARTVGNLGDREGALQLHRRSLALAMETYGPDHPGTAAHQHQLSMALARVGRCSEAESLQRSAIRTWIRTTGEKSRSIVNGYNNLGVLDHSRWRLSAAEHWYRRAMVLDQEIGGRSPILRANLADVLSDQGMHREAEVLAREALQMETLRSGLEENALIAEIHTALGRMLLFRERADSAEVWVRRGLAIFERLPQGAEPAPYGWLALALAAQGRPSVADSILHANREQFVKGYYLPPMKHRLLPRLARYYRERGDSAEGAYYQAAYAALPR